MAFEFKNKDILELLLKGKREQIQEQIDDIHPANILSILREYNGDKLNLLHHFTDEMIALIIDYAEDDEKYEILSLFPSSKQMEIVEEMASDELVDLLGAIQPDEANEILDKMSREDAKELVELMHYDQDSAGGIMAKEYISVMRNMTVKETLELLRKEEPEAETAYYLYVLNESGQLNGVVSLRDLVISDLDVRISDIMHEKIITVPVHMDQEEVGRIFEKYDYLSMPVVDDEDRMLGIISIDDIMDVLRFENTEDIFKLAGIGEGESLNNSLKESISKRLPWLFVNLMTALIASATVNLFQGTIQKVVVLATLMPIIAGMGGNAGTQTLTIIVRGIALGELTFENAKRVLIKEVGVGLLAGTSIGITVGLLAFFWDQNPILGVVIGLAMLLNMIVATISGYFVPVILKKFHIDPALASAVFVTTVTDVLGFFFFLGLATLFIEYLI
ncbi:MAG: magnesium transporter [Firmicutes bacterium HGW-Firmicutes-7]|nr:MAG: magnesium transporter [Firmicutes bacterium HGW-Firmicutes-7]